MSQSHLPLPALPTRPPGPLRALLGLATLVVALTAASASPAAAQSIEPRSYSNAPIGSSFLILGFAYTEGGLATDPAVPLTEPDLAMTSGVLGYARILDLWGRSAKFDVIVPYSFLDGTALFAGEPVAREIAGLADPSFRLAVNFHGAPALTPEEFRSYQQDLIVGASVQVTPPLGQYDETRLVNIGMNRWTVKTEVGLSQAKRQWTFEGKGAVTIYTDNDDFNRGKTREQDPIWSASGHVIYNFPRGRWGSFDVTWFTGGRTTLEGAAKDDLQDNWRIGGTFAIPVNRQNSIKLYASSGVQDRTGNSYDLLGIAWQYRWFAGRKGR